MGKSIIAEAWCSCLTHYGRRQAAPCRSCEAGRCNAGHDAGRAAGEHRNHSWSRCWEKVSASIFYPSRCSEDILFLLSLLYPPSEPAHPVSRESNEVVRYLFDGNF